MQPPDDDGHQRMNTSTRGSWGRPTYLAASNLGQRCRPRPHKMWLRSPWCDRTPRSPLPHCPPAASPLPPQHDQHCGDGHCSDVSLPSTAGAGCAASTQGNASLCKTPVVVGGGRGEGGRREGERGEEGGGTKKEVCVCVGGWGWVGVRGGRVELRWQNTRESDSRRPLHPDSDPALVAGVTLFSCNALTAEESVRSEAREMSSDFHVQDRQLKHQLCRLLHSATAREAGRETTSGAE